MKTESFDYNLPKKLIAQLPVDIRTDSRLMVLNRKTNSIQHSVFKSLLEFLEPNDILVLNNTQVIPARLHAKRKTGGNVELLILDGWRGCKTRVLIKPAKRIKSGEILICEQNWNVRIIDRQHKYFNVEFNGEGDFFTFLECCGQMPVPPYIHRDINDEKIQIDKLRYQTVYAKNPGAVAAPTAGLHFSDTLLMEIQNIGIEILFVSLHVGWGTFKPIETEYINEHKMETEHFTISSQTAEKIRQAKKEKRRIVAVGTTTTRALESWVTTSPKLNPVIDQESAIFIYPGYKFKCIDALITNFHLPKSTLIMLVSAFAGREKILNAYNLAIQNEYRFYSYGDAMLIF